MLLSNLKPLWVSEVVTLPPKFSSTVLLLGRMRSDSLSTQSQKDAPFILTAYQLASVIGPGQTWRTLLFMCTPVREAPPEQVGVQAAQTP